MNEVDRFLSKVVPPTEPGGCSEWSGPKTGGGYGIFFTYDSGKQRNVGAHRYAYELHVGPIPDGLVIDHLCGTRACTVPEHLEAVTQRENVHRSEGRTAVNARKTHCPQGHPYDEANTYTYRGMRSCRACGVEKRRRYLARKAMA